jgi:hypothetical protein
MIAEGDKLAGWWPFQCERLDGSVMLCLGALRTMELAEKKSMMPHMYQRNDVA